VRAVVVAVRALIGKDLGAGGWSPDGLRGWWLGSAIYVDLTTFVFTTPRRHNAIQISSGLRCFINARTAKLFASLCCAST
jgi:hypothetical protein